MIGKGSFLKISANVKIKKNKNKKHKNSKHTKLSTKLLTKSLYLQADWFSSVCQHT